ncbi:hypothetical protein [Streptomyces sp. NPDC101206]|uniref:hypothetical protein n=1 Tax=Streptomyces sp. NPDC101206 TaxID=3366128 RepID=UPI0038207926
MAFGAVLTAAGAVLDLLPGPGMPLFAVGALVDRAALVRYRSGVELRCAPVLDQGRPAVLR